MLIWVVRNIYNIGSELNTLINHIRLIMLLNNTIHVEGFLNAKSQINYSNKQRLLEKH